MVVVAPVNRVIDRLLSIGAYPGESDTQRARRRITVAAILLDTLFSVFGFISDANAGYSLLAWVNLGIFVLTVLVLIALQLRPLWFAPLINALFAGVTIALLAESTLFGGFLESGLVVMFSLIIVIGALITLGSNAAYWWFAAFVVSVVYALLIPNWVDPVYVMSNPGGDAAFNLIAAGAVTLAVMIYFVRQRDSLQRQSDDLLHNILPDEIANRLKTDSTMIADSFESASVLFADVVDFTPMSAEMSPAELVGLLNSVFTTFDGFVDELGLEKIKTVGDEYMAAAGVPEVRPDHAEAIAELALRIRDHVSAHEFEGHRITVRIGINSGPVVAGIIGSHKFAYDLWGDVVNTASRMQSEGVPGAIQVSAPTYELIRGQFICEPRGVISVKGKGEMDTYILVSRRSAAVSDSLAHNG